MTSSHVLEAIDKYAKLYQWTYRLSLEWEIKQQRLLYVSEKKLLVKWKVFRAIVICGVVCGSFVTFKPLFVKTKDDLPTWKIFYVATLGLMGGLTTVFTYELCKNGQELVFVFNSILRLGDNIFYSKFHFK